MKKKIPVFTPEQLEFLLTLMPETRITINATKEEHVHELIKRNYRETIIRIGANQGFQF